jgi:glycosyltransferase involved in cell wall biosynthesis
MSSGLPVVASDLAVHREICGDAAIYFPRFSEENLAAQLLELASDEKRRSVMSETGLARSKDFSWDRHVSSLLALSAQISR